MPPPLLLERVAAPGQTVQRGVPEGGAALPPPTTTAPGAPPPAAPAYYLMIKAGKNAVTAYPVDLIYGFKPPYRWLVRQLRGVCACVCWRGETMGDGSRK